MANGAQAERSCWVTLLTKPSYLPGVVILAHTLDKHGSRYPLVVQYTNSLGAEATSALEAEASHGRIVPQYVELLLPPPGRENTAIVAERFKDTFTKLRAFQVYEQGYTRAVFLDADMAVFRNPDIIFETKMPGRDWLGANHACVCNLDHDEWAPEEWHKGNCAYTALEGPKDVAPTPNSNSRPTYRLLNGGTFLFNPSEKLWNDLLHFFNTSDKVKSYQFPDQDFLGDFYENKWQPVSWKYNALKTMRYWHPKMWDDDELVVLHYIVDKPWERPVSDDGIAGHLGRDGETHSWWWKLFRDWEQARSREKDGAILGQMDKLVGHGKPFDRKVPLPQEPGRPEDVAPFP
ncbi:Galactinol synthase 1 [Cyphellophora attinorum]|uniref:Galactinol synthase 1 n=1 Tax=Cyphellophora attinorum TaxID=1664694 RepID=A0A0N0NJH6_9EURO|nr:Galactinol synthase 1 [Phialophora attinorum]KPI36991.1 Galactinol synthase 1 [Phialophora attinorum]